MQHIQVLDEDTINKIAAGEVVERPMSVVKELVENAVDAGASAVTVEIKDGGTSMIRVTDNGCGIDKEDVDNAFASHATSKIKTAQDLLKIGTLGFRGEALSSIASVSQVELITKTHASLTGVRYRISGGRKEGQEDVGAPDGTTIVVRNLFYNTPARRKFLKTNVTEAGYVSDLMGRLALSHPEISFKYINNGQIKLHTSGNSNLKDIVYQVFGRDITGNLLPVSAKTDILTVSGFIGKPVLSRGNRSWENYFINGRYIKSNIITKAIEDAYKTFVMVHKFPFTALEIEIDPADIDVNVHPRKMEIRFDSAEKVYSEVYELLRSVLEGRELIPEVLSEEEKAPEKKEEPPEPFELKRLASLGERRKSYAGYGNLPHSTPGKTGTSGNTWNRAEKIVENKSGKTEKASQMELFSDKLLSEKARPYHRLIGQLFKTYWLLEYDEKLFIVDQHAAHEKVLYERLMREYRNRMMAQQMLSPPVVVTLSDREAGLYEQYKDYFSSLSFSVEPFGGKEYAITAVPLQLFKMSVKDMFLEVLDGLSEESTKTSGDAVTYKIASMACKAAVKGSRLMSFEEAEALIDELMQTEDPYSCPHGRPTIIAVSKYELDKKFGRIQNQEITWSEKKGRW